MTTFTNPDNGVSVVSLVSGTAQFDVRDDGDGAYTLISIRTGRPGSLKIVNGPYLFQDVGKITFYDHFDADDNYLGTDVVVNGPHPEYESGFTLFCDAAIAALGL